MESGQKGTNTLRRYKASAVEVPADYSRERALRFAKDHAEIKGGAIDPLPEPEARVELYKLHMKIGASGELPADKNLRESFLNDFWVTLYLRNNLCPVDIPFGIIIREFTTAMVQGVIDRKGNNQAALCQAFNKWIIRQETRNMLYQKRDQMYPNRKPKQVAANATPETIEDYTDEELKQKITAIEPMEGIKMVDMMLGKLRAEKKRRGIE